MKEAQAIQQWIINIEIIETCNEKLQASVKHSGVLFA